MTSSSSISPLFVRFASMVLIGSIPFAGSASGLAAVDVEDVAGDERSFVRRDEDDRVGKLLREAEATHRNTRHQSRLVLRRAREAGQHASVGGTRRNAIHADS